MHPSLFVGALDERRSPYVEVRSEMAFVELPSATMSEAQDILLDEPERCGITGLFETVNVFGRHVQSLFERQGRCGDDPLIRSANRLRSAVVVDRPGSTVGADVQARVERAVGRGSYDQPNPTK